MIRLPNLFKNRNKNVNRLRCPTSYEAPLTRKALRPRINSGSRRRAIPNPASPGPCSQTQNPFMNELPKILNQRDSHV